MTTKAVLKLAEELLDRAFREAEGQADRKVDLVLLIENARSTPEKVEPALEYLHSRGLIHPPTGDSLYLTARGTEAVATEQDIKAMPKFEKAWGASPGQPAAAVPVVPAQPAHPRPYRPQLSFVDPNGVDHHFELEWVATVGRSDEATLTLPDPRASKRHVEIKYVGDRYVVRDLGSANGTMVNGGYVEQHPLSHGDVLLIGRTEVTYTCPEVMPEPRGEPPPDMASARPRVPVAGEPTARPAPVAAAPAIPVPVVAVTPPVSVSPSLPTFGESRGDVVRRPDVSRPEPSRPELARAEPPRAEPVRPGRPIAPAVPVRPMTPATAPVPPAVAARRRTAGTPLSSVDVPIVKGRPEAPPSAAAEDPSGLFEGRGSAPARGGDLFGDAPTLAPPAAPAQARPDLFGPTDPPPPVRGTPAPDLFAGPTAPPPAVRGTPAPDLFEAGTAPPGSTDMFAAARAAQHSGAAPDLFAPASPARPAQSAPDLFAPASTPRPGQTGPDLFAARNDERPADLLAPERASTARAAPDLFAEPAPVEQPEPGPESYAYDRGSVSPLPLGSVARPPEDLLPLDEPIEMGGDGVVQLDVVVDDGPVEVRLDADDDGGDATVAGMNPLLLAAAALDSAPAQPAVAVAPVASAPPVALAPPEPVAPEPLEELAIPELPPEPTGRTSELPAWSRGTEDSSLEPFAHADPVEAEPLMVGPPDDGGFDERTPVEDGHVAAPEQILAAASELPEAPAALEDLSGDVSGPVAWPRFADTLVILRTRLAEAGVPDQARLVDAIELLRKHPSVRAALTDP